MNTIEARVEELLARMTLPEKIGQMWQIHGAAPENKEFIRRGQVGSCLNVIGRDAEAFQRVARAESRLGIPLIFGRDVIHGFKTILPIPLGQAASFNPEVARDGARMAAHEAAAASIHWTFAPMVDIAHDPRWGRVAEGCGEDPYLAGCMGAAMVEGFQGSPVTTTHNGPKAQRAKAQKNLAKPGSIAACAKHYVGYGAAEGGRDYNTTLIPERTLRNTYLPPFKACVDAGACTLMSAFNDLNDVPATGNAFALRQVLKKEWKFDGFVVSDWGSVTEMIAHGYCADEKEAAFKSARAGVDMEMVSPSYSTHLEKLVADGTVPLDWIDDAVRRILRIKFRLGLFDRPVVPEIPPSVILSHEHLRVAYRAALESCVLLKNDGCLPVAAGHKTIAVIGPLANAPADQLGCWVMDGDQEAVCTPLLALRLVLGSDCLLDSPGLRNARDTGRVQFDAAEAAARVSDVILLFLGEDAGLSGEAHCRAFLELPGAQTELVDRVTKAAAGKPVIAVVMAGRPLVVQPWINQVSALLWAWHPGSMGGAAITDLLLGSEAPSGRLPISFPRTVGQVPTYYNKKNTGRPPIEGQWGAPLGTPLDPKDFTSKYMDADFTPEFTFGFGLGYTTFAYSAVTLSRTSLKPKGTLTAKVTITNTGTRPGAAVPQLYIRDLTATATRPLKELKGFQKFTLAPGESRTVTFDVGSEELAFWNGDMKFAAEPGRFHLWIAADSTCASHPPAEFALL